MLQGTADEEVPYLAGQILDARLCTTGQVHEFVMVLLFAMTIQKIWGADTWWQLATGRWIVEHTELKPLYEEFAKADAAAGDYGLALVTGSRSPAMSINMDWAGTEQFCIDLALGVGGVLGGLFNALVAPLVFREVWEYPLVVALACMMRPKPQAAKRAVKAAIVSRRTGSAPVNARRQLRRSRVFTIVIRTVFTPCA